MNVASKVHAYTAFVAAILWFSAPAQSILDGSGITYTSERQGTMRPAQGTSLLEGKARAESSDFTLEAEYIVVDWNRREIKAYGARQADGTYVGRPIFTQGDRRIGADTLRYNYGTQKGWVFQSSSQEAGGFLFGKQVKMISDSSYYIGATRFTTCNHAEPHFAIVAPQARLDVGKRIVTGPAYLELAHLPTPLALPFGFFPMTEKR
ncbi:MAG: putative LPS assembly protein LptD, partial [Schleiferiaceae bacterium]